MTPGEIGRAIVYADRELVVVDKPIGLVSGGPDRLIHGEAAPRQSVESLLVKHLGRPIWVVHQLDRNTSGLNCFVLRASAVQRWNDRLKHPGTKRYLAIVHGVPRFDETTIDHPLGERLALSGKTFPALVPSFDATARPAKSRVIVLVRGERFSLVEVIPYTGRTHQVRLHLAALDHPLVGEPIHRDPPCTLHPRHALHAARLEFVATTVSTREGPLELPALSLSAPLPDDLRQLAAQLGLALPG